MRNKLFIGTGLILTVLGLYLVILSQQKPKDAEAGTITRTVDILGTGTSSVGTYNFGAAATTTVLVVLGSQVDTVDFDIYPQMASSTAHVGIQVAKSSLSRCGASGASSDYVDAITTTTVSGSKTTITSGTSTVQWVPSGGTKYQLTNVNAYCLKVDIGGQDVNLYIQANLKSLSF